MIRAIALRFITSAWGRYLLGALSILAAVTSYGRSKKRAGAAEATANHREQVLDRTERGVNAYIEKRRQAAGRSVDALIDRMRGRDSYWRRMRNLR